MRVAILEDDKDQADILCSWLEEEGYSCFVFTKGTDFLQGYAKESYDAVILDWNVPEGSGIDVVAHIRASADGSVPIIFTTARDSEQDIVSALEIGADDYMVKPIKRSETVARIKALLRRSNGNVDEYKELHFEPFVIDTKTREVKNGDEPITLTQKEYDLLVFLFRNSGRVISRGHLLQVVWGTNPQINTRTVDTHISRLRNKLSLKPDLTGWELTSVYQHGYRLEKV